MDSVMNRFSAASSSKIGNAISGVAPQSSGRGESENRFETGIEIRIISEDAEDAFIREIDEERQVRRRSREGKGYEHSEMNEVNEGVNDGLRLCAYENRASCESWRPRPLSPLWSLLWSVLWSPHFFGRAGR